MRQRRATQYGGHHLAADITLSGDTMTLGPTLWGAQPAYCTRSGATVEPLVGETDKAYTVLQPLNSTQPAAAVLDTPVKEVILAERVQRGEAASADEADVDQRLCGADTWPQPYERRSGSARG
ncbi:DUF3500 domain-containing protein [Streptomyces sp. NPDC002156]